MQIHNKPYNNKLCSQLTPIPLPLSKGQLLSLASQLDQIKQTTNAIKLRIKFGPAHRRALIARANFLPPFSCLNYGGENLRLRLRPCPIWTVMPVEDLYSSTVKTQIIGRCAMSLELPPLVRSGIFCFFMFLKGTEQLCFCCVLHPFSKVGNSRLHSTPTDYLEFLRYLLQARSDRERGFGKYMVKNPCAPQTRHSYIRSPTRLHTALAPSITAN